MKRFLLLFAVCVFGSSLYAQSVSVENPTVHPIMVQVISVDAPGWMRVSGPGRYVCNLDDDQIEIQAAIDYCEALYVTPGKYTPEVHFSAGRYNIEAPIYMGMAATSGFERVDQNGTCSLISDGEVRWDWTGSDQVSPAEFMLNIGPSSNYPDFEISGLTLAGNDELGGIYMSGVVAGTIRNVKVLNFKHFGIFANESVLARFENVRVTGCEGMDWCFLTNNASRISGCRTDNNDGTNIPDIKLYGFDADTGAGAWYTTFWPREVVSIGGKTAVFLGWSRTPFNRGLVVAHTAGGDFANNEVITGAESGDTATLTTDKLDMRSCLYTNGDTVTISDLAIEAHAFGDSYPLILVHGRGTVLDTIRIESATSAKIADTWITVEDATSVTLRNIVSDSQFHTNGVLLDANVTMTDNGATGTLSGMTEAFVSDLSVGDSIYVWDPAGGGVTPGVYTVSDPIPGATSVDTDEDPEGTSAGVINVYAITRAAAEYHATCVNLENADHAYLENVFTKYCVGDAVVIDSDCDGVTCSNVRAFLGVTVGLPDNWLAEPRPTNLIANAGTRTTVINPQIWDGTDGTVGMTGAEDTYGVDQTFDGPEIASAGALAIGPAWGPNCKVYVTGQIAVTTITGGHLGQTVTLVGTDSTGFALTDDNDNIQVSGGTVTLDDYEAVTMICVDETNQKWQDVRLQD